MNPVHTLTIIVVLVDIPVTVIPKRDPRQTTMAEQYSCSELRKLVSF